MAVSVVKKSGEKEDFQRKKVVESCVKSGAPRDLAEEIGDDIESAVTDGISTDEIRDMILEKLGDVRKEWVNDWKEFEKTK